MKRSYECEYLPDHFLFICWFDQVVSYGIRTLALCMFSQLNWKALQYRLHSGCNVSSGSRKCDVYKTYATPLSTPH